MSCPFSRSSAWAVRQVDRVKLGGKKQTNQTEIFEMWVFEEKGEFRSKFEERSEFWDLKWC